jgi:hypothetical protein
MFEVWQNFATPIYEPLWSQITGALYEDKVRSAKGARPFSFLRYFPSPPDILTDIVVFPAAGSDNSCDWFYEKSERLLFSLRSDPAKYNTAL